MNSIAVPFDLLRVNGLSTLLRISVAASLMAVVAVPANAVPVQASATLTADGTNYQVPVTWDSALGLYAMGTFNPNTNDYDSLVVETAGYKVSVGGGMEPDPMISYGITVTDFGTPSSFGFFFSSPIALGPGPTTVSASVVGGLTDFTGNGVKIVPTLADADGDTIPELQVNTAGLTTNLGVDVGPLNVHVPGAAGSFYSYGPYAAGPQPGPAGPFGTLDITLGFSLSGSGDIASLTGSASIVPAPEPSTFVLGALGIVGLVWHIRRRKSS